MVVGSGVIQVNRDAVKDRLRWKDTYGMSVSEYEKLSLYAEHYRVGLYIVRVSLRFRVVKGVRG